MSLQGNEHNTKGFKAGLTYTSPTSQTNTGGLQLPTTAAELTVVARLHAEAFLQWIQDAGQTQIVNKQLHQTVENLERDATTYQDQISALKVHINNLDETITKHEQEADTGNAVLEALREKLQVAEETLSATLTVNNTPSFRAPKDSAVKSEKMPDPPIFYGDQKQIRGWMADMSMKLLVNADRYPTVQSQLAYIVSRTGGNAKEQLLPHIKNGQVKIDSSEACFTILSVAFDDPDRKATALRKLRNLKQGNKPFNEYLAEFQRYIAEADYNDEAKKNTLMGGISDELLDLMVTQDEPSTYDASITLLQKLDSKRRARNIVYSYKHTAPTRPVFQSPQAPDQRQPVPPAPSNSSGFRTVPRPQAPSFLPTPRAEPDVMDLSQAIKKRAPSRDYKGPRRPISDTEKQRRIDDDDCLYCGEHGHYARDCEAKKRAHIYAHSAVLKSIDEPQQGNEEPST
jgi:Retrotransposon gag protein